jgi:hypothetical protein
MKPAFLNRALLAALVFLAAPACSDTATQAQPVAAATADPNAVAAEMFAEGRKTAADKPDIAPETVLKLNPIVARSKAALDRFDALAADLEAARKADDKVRISAIIEEFTRLKADAEAAHAQFQAEKKSLVARKEYYNPVVLDAMEQFVAEAPGEIADAITAQTK